MTTDGPRRGWGPAAGTPLELRRLTLADLVIVAGTVLYLIFAIIPWFSVDGVDFGFGYRSRSYSVTGFHFGLITLSFILLLLAAVWTALPAVTDVRVPFPRALVTVGLAGLAFLFTLIEWLRSLDAGFSVMALLTFLVSVTVLAIALLRLFPELRNRFLLPGELPNAAHGASQSAPPFGRHGGSGQQMGRGQHGEPGGHTSGTV